MLYSFFGTDTIQARAAAQECIDSHKKDGASVTRFTKDNWNAGDVDEAVGSTSLFGGSSIYVLDTPGEDAEMRTYTYKNLKDFADSPNTWVLVEGKLLAADKKKVEKYSENATEHTLEKEKPFNIFGLADALLRKDKKSLWILYTEAKQAGHADEEILGTLFWQVKVLMLAQKTQSAEEAGVSNFPYSKAKRALRNFTKEDIEKMLTELVTIYHEGHLGIRDMGDGLEEWVLTR